MIAKKPLSSKKGCLKINQTASKLNYHKANARKQDESQNEYFALPDKHWVVCI